MYLYVKIFHFNKYHCNKSVSLVQYKFNPAKKNIHLGSLYRFPIRPLWRGEQWLEGKYSGYGESSSGQKLFHCAMWNVRKLNVVSWLCAAVATQDYLVSSSGSHQPYITYKHLHSARCSLSSLRAVSCIITSLILSNPHIYYIFTEEHFWAMLYAIIPVSLRSAWTLSTNNKSFNTTICYKNAICFYLKLLHVSTHTGCRQGRMCERLVVLSLHSCERQLFVTVIYSWYYWLTAPNSSLNDM
jgi:hypothetical protein